MHKFTYKHYTVARDCLLRFFFTWLLNERLNPPALEAMVVKRINDEQTVLIYSCNYVFSGNMQQNQTEKLIVHVTVLYERCVNIKCHNFLTAQLELIGLQSDTCIC